MFKERYNRMMEGVEPSQELVQRTLNAAMPRRMNANSWKPVLLCVLCVAMVGVPVLWKLMHTASEPHDIVVSDNPSNPTPVNSMPSDELTLSVSDVMLVNESKLSLVLTICGDRVDPLTTIDLNYPLGHFQHIGFGNAEACEDQQPNKVCFPITFEANDCSVLSEIGNTLELSVCRYTSGNTQTQIIHEIDWSGTEFDLQEAGEPTIDLGNDMAITGFGFSEEGWLTTQTRWPLDAQEPTYIFTWISTDGTNESSTNIYMRSGKQYSSGEYCYNNQVFHITQDELDGMYLVTAISLAGEVIEGYWPVTVDLTQLTAE